jgi:hypothetical protein
MSNVLGELDHVLSRSVETQICQLTERIVDSINPYSRFVRIEIKTLDHLSSELRDIKTEASAIRSALSKI